MEQLIRPSLSHTHLLLLLLLLLLLFPHISPISRTRGHRPGFPFHTIATSKKTNKRREREEKRTDEKASPDLIGGEGQNKTRAKNKSKDPPRISERQIKKQARQTKCQDHTTTVDTVRESLSTPHQSLGGGSGQSNVETKEHQNSNAKNHPLLFCGIQIDIMGAQTVK